jgi:hypothetical protein
MNALAQKIVDRSKPPTGRAKVWAILNATFTIWVLTAIVGTVFAATYTGFQSCIKDADDKITRYSHLMTEMQSRVSNTLYALQQSQSASDLKARLAKPYFTRVEYKDSSVVTLNSDLNDVRGFVQPNLERQTAMNAVEPTQLSAADNALVAGVLGVVPLDFTDKEYARLKELQPVLLQIAYRTINFHSSWLVSGNCTVGSSLASLVGIRPFTMKFIHVTFQPGMFIPLSPQQPTPIKQ